MLLKPHAGSGLSVRSGAGSQESVPVDGRIEVMQTRSSLVVRGR